MEVLIVTAFVGGVLMFLAPCTLPLVPAFLASITTASHTNVHGVYTNERTLVIRIVAFILGFTSIFVLFGILASYLSDAFISYKTILSQVGGFFVIIFGLSTLGVFNIPALEKSFSLLNTSLMGKTKRTTPAILGSLFALGWAPCAGPILTSILLLTSQSTTMLQGGFLLLVFSLGLAIPFFLVGFFYARIHIFLSIYERYIRLVNALSGVFLIGIGVLLVFGKYLILTKFGFDLYSFFGYVPMCTYY